MKKLLLMACVLTWAASAMAAGFPVFVGSNLDYFTNATSELRFFGSNQLIWTVIRAGNEIQFNANVNLQTINDGSVLGIASDGDVVAVTNGYGIEVASPLTLQTVNRVHGEASASTLQLDFASITNTYEITNLAANLTIQITNWTHGRDKWVYLRTDGSERTVTVSTNGSTVGISVQWGLTSITNGGTAFTVTNRARINFACLPVAEVAAAYEYQQ